MGVLPEDLKLSELLESGAGPALAAALERRACRTCGCRGMVARGGGRSRAGGALGEAGDPGGLIGRTPERPNGVGRQANGLG